MNILEHFVHHFLPHRHNNHRARALHPSILFLYLLFFIVFQFISPFLLKMRGNVPGYAVNIQEDKLLELTNQKRFEQGLKPLKYNALLAEAARAKAAYMFQYDFWAHNGPDGTSPWKFITDVKYDYVYAGENLAKDFDDSASVVDAWMNSPTHRENILQAKYEDIGFAVVNGTLKGEETTLVVQMFGTLVSTVPEVSAAKIEKMSEPAQNLFVSVSGTQNMNFSLSKFLLTKEFSFVFIGFLILLLLVDGLFIWKNNIIRFSGQNFAHLLFLSGLFFAVFLIQRGSIL